MQNMYPEFLYSPLSIMMNVCLVENTFSEQTNLQRRQILIISEQQPNSIKAAEKLAPEMIQR